MVFWYCVISKKPMTHTWQGIRFKLCLRVSGSVTKVWADNTDFCKRRRCSGHSRPDRCSPVRLKKAKTALASSVRQTHQLMINSKQLQANIEVQKIAPRESTKRLQPPCAAGQCQPDWSRRAATRPRRRHSVPGRNWTSLFKQYNANQAMILGTKLEDQPAVQQAATGKYVTHGWRWSVPVLSVR